MRLRSAALAVGLCLLAATTPAFAGSALTQYGFRGGLSLDPDQFVVGAFLQLEDFTPGFGLRPSGDIGLGDDVLVVMINGDVQYEFSHARMAAVPYVGAGIGLAYIKWDAPAFVDDSSTEGGVNLYGGFEKDLGGYRTGHLELRLGVGDIPDLKFMAGFGFN